MDGSFSFIPNEFSVNGQVYSSEYQYDYCYEIHVNTLVWATGSGRVAAVDRITDTRFISTTTMASNSWAPSTCLNLLLLPFSSVTYLQNQRRVAVVALLNVYLVLRIRQPPSHPCPSRPPSYRFAEATAAHPHCLK